MENQIESLIRNTIESLFKRAGFAFDDIAINKNSNLEGQDVYIVRINSNEDCSLLLDERGKNLKALEHLTRLLALKGLDQRVGLILDLNNFLEKRNDRISELARLVAEKVQATQKSFTLRPMSAYERRLVHLELSSWPDIKTESIGEEPRRRVIIRPV